MYVSKKSPRRLIYESDNRVIIGLDNGLLSKIGLDHSVF